MTILALRTSRHANGVSKLHGEVSRRSVERCLDRRAAARSADHQHHQRHSHQDLDGAGICRALRQVSRPTGRKISPNEDFWRRVIDIPDDDSLGHAPEAEAASGRVRPRTRAPLSASASANRRKPFARRIAFSIPRCSPSVSRDVSPPTNAATLLFSDLDRLQKLLNDTDAAGAVRFRRQSASERRRRQSVHPGGLQVLARMPDFENRIVFVEDYDTYVGRRLYRASIFG